jgi:Uncharacterized protein involved in biosynthesis of c-type cytochromes
MKALLRAAVLALWCGAAVAAIEELEFQNPEQEQRYQQLIDVMRCPMCLNSNLSGSDAPIAADLRAEIRAQILEGKTDEEIVDFMKARYGDFILYRPPLNRVTALLWFGPLVLLALGFVVARRMLTQQPAKGGSEETLSQEESARLQELLRDEDVSKS